jgi:hypothetical protein
MIRRLFEEETEEEHNDLEDFDDNSNYDDFGDLVTCHLLMQKIKMEIS